MQDAIRKYHKANANPAAQQHKNAGVLHALFSNTKGTAFANITQATQVKLAAAHKDHSIIKVSRANVTLFANVNAAKEHFANAVKRSATSLGESSQSNIDNFQQQSNWFTHDHSLSDLYCIVRHCHKDSYYLYAVYNSVQETAYYSEDLGRELSKEEVAEYMTPSAAKALLNPDKTVHNKTHDVKHNVTLRTVGLQNVVSITANKQTVDMA